MARHEHGRNDPRERGFWGALSVAERGRLTAAGRPTVFRAGTVICHEGDPTSHVVIILGGWAKVHTSTATGHDVVLDVRGPGDTVGEMAMMTNRVRSATVSAIDEVRSLIVGPQRFGAFMAASPNAAVALQREVVDRLRDASSRFSWGTAEGAGRLAHLLVHLMGEDGLPAAGGVTIALPLSQDELAGWVGTSRETVARTLRRWRERRIVATGRRTITVLDPDALRKLTEMDGE